MRDYIERFVKLAEDFVNTYDVYLEQPEWLQTPHDLEAFLVKHDVKVDGPLEEAALQEAYTLRDQLRVVYSTSQEEEAARILNKLLSEVSLRPKLVREADQNWYVHLWVEAEASPIQRLRAQVAVGLSYALEHYGKARLRVCTSKPCRDVFLDTSRNGTRRFCCDRCANRYNVAAFRARQDSQQ
jgi:predicted RNA-binding Zn ribbon-like protein